LKDELSVNFQGEKGVVSAPSKATEHLYKSRKIPIKMSSTEKKISYEDWSTLHSFWQWQRWKRGRCEITAPRCIHYYGCIASNIYNIFLEKYYSISFGRQHYSTTVSPLTMWW
jgi:hypothetical protein